MPAGVVTGTELDRLYLGDRRLLGLHVDLVSGRAVLSIDTARLDPAPPREWTGSVEVAEVSVVVNGVRAFRTEPRHARPDGTILRWSFDVSTSGATVMLYVVGDPEPVSVLLEGAGVRVEHAR